MMSRRLAVVAVAIVVTTVGCGSTDSSTNTKDAERAFDVAELDPSHRACTDFYGFVNDKWIEAAKIPADNSSYGLFDELYDRTLDAQKEIAESAVADLGSLDHDSDRYKIGKIYQAALDEQAINAAGAKPLEPDLARVDRINSPADIAAFIREDAERGGGIVLGLGAGSDFKDASKQIGFVYSDGLRLPSKEYYTDPTHADILDAYRTYVTKSLQLIGVNDADAAAQSAQAVAFESQLAAATLSPTEARKPENQYKLVTVDEANAITPAFDWRAFFTALKVSPDEKFSMAETPFFTELNTLITTAPIEQWRAYLRARVVDRAAARLAQPFRDNRFEFNKQLSGAAEQPARWKVGVSAINGAMGQAVGHLYVDKAFDATAKERAEKLVHNILDAVKARIEKVEWMSAETKQKAIEKWSLIVPRIGYPDKWRDYSGLKLDESSYYAMLESADQFAHEYDLAKINKPTDRTEWISTPQTVNAFYSRDDNTINFPAGILQAPFFDPNADDALNYGGIGSIIGHEITHGFDDQGSKFDGKGNQVEWWTEADREAFEKRTDRLVQQFNGYAPLPSKPDLHINGELTLGENLADLGGLNAAFDAYKNVDPDERAKEISGYTGDQRFFLGFARLWREKLRDESAATQISSDPHSIASYRVNGVVPNVPAFGESFKCAPTDPMVSSDPVVVW